MKARCMAFGAGVAVAIAALTIASWTRAGEPGFVPTLGIEYGRAGERMLVRFDGQEQHEDRLLSNTRLFLGLSTRTPRLGVVATRNEATLGYGWIHHTGHGIVELRDDAIAEYSLGNGFALPFGPGLGLTVDTTATRRSSLQVGVPVGLRYRSVELLARPAYVIPLGSEDSSVFAGTRELSARPGLVLLDFTLRLRLGALE